MSLRLKVIAYLKRYEWILICLAFVGLFIFSLTGFSPCIGSNSCTWLSDTPQSWQDSLFFTLQMLVMNFGGIHGVEVPWQIQIVRFGLPFMASLSIIKGLLKIAAYRQLSFFIRFWHGHIIFCGCGDQARALIRQYLSQGLHKKIIVIDVNDTPENKKLANEGVKFLKEDAKLPDVLRQVGIKRARCVYIMAGADQANLEIFEAFKEVVEAANFETSSDSGRNCFIHIYDSTLKSSIDTDIYKGRVAGPNKGWEVRTINAWENSARVLFTGDHGPHLHCSDTQQPHILILGHGWLAEQLIIQGARLGHYPGGRKLRITYIDDDADHLRDTLYARFPVLDPKQSAHMDWHEKERCILPVIDTCFIAKSADRITGEIFAKIIEPAPLSVAYICHSDDEQALQILSALKSNLSTPKGQKTEIVLCDAHGHNFSFVTKSDNDQCPQIHYFDAVSAGLNLKKGEDVIEEFREEWAKSIHEHYRALYSGDDWEKLPENMRDSNRQSSDHWKIKLDWIKSKSQGDMVAAIENHLDVLMSLEHDRWCAERFMNGWRFCDKPKNKDEQTLAKARKQNWCLCSFDALSNEDKEKDKDVCDIAAKMFPLYGE